MKAITVQQPWAWAIIHGGKDVENRTQLWKHRGPLAIHAGNRWSERGFALMPSFAERGILQGRPIPIGRAGYTQGAILGVVDLVDAHEQEDGCCDSPWAESQYVDASGVLKHLVCHLVLSNPRAVQPVDVRGRLGLWDIPDDLIEAA